MKIGWRILFAAFVLFLPREMLREAIERAVRETSPSSLPATEQQWEAQQMRDWLKSYDAMPD